MQNFPHLHRQAILPPPSRARRLNLTRRATSDRERHASRAVKWLAPVMAALALLASSAQAQNGTWTLNGNGSWSTSGNWAGGTIASGADNTAFFNTINITVSDKTVTVDAGRTIGDIITGDTSGAQNWIFSGATLTLSHSSLQPQIRTLQNTATFNCVLDGIHGLRKEQAATLVLAAPNTYSGNTSINRGTLRIGNVEGIPHGAGKGDVYMNNVGGAPVLDLSTFSPTINGLISTNAVGTVNSSGAAGTSTLTVGDNNATTTYSGVIVNGASRTLALTKIGTGTQSLTGANTYSGATTINAGTLAADALNTLSPRSAITVEGGTLEIDVNHQSIHSLTLNSGTVSGSTGELTATNAVTGFTVKSGTVSAILAGAATVPLIKTTTGTVTLTAANLYNGNTIVIGGVLIISNDGNLGDSSGDITLGGGTLRVDTGGFSSARPVTLTGDSALDNASGGSVTLTGGIAKGGNDITFSGGGGGTTYIGTTPISGAADVIVDGTTLQYDVVQTYDGPTAIRNGGTLSLGVNNAMPASPRSALVLDDLGSGSSTLNAGGFDAVTLSLAGDATSVVSMVGGQLTIGGGSATFAGVISGAGTSLVKDSSGTQALTGANTYDNGTTISGGTLSAGAANTLPSGGDVTVNGGSLNIGANNQSVGVVTLAAGSIAGTSGVLTGTSYDVQSGSVSAILAGPGVALTKNTDGTVTLSGVSTYSGNTTVNAGYLAMEVGGSAVNSAATVADLATNGVVITDNTLQWTFKGWTNASGGTEYLDFYFGSVTPSTTTAPLQVTDDFSIEGALNILVRGISFPDGTYPLVTNINGTIDGTLPGSTLNQVFSRTTATLAKSGDQKSILMTTASTSPITWQPAGGFWNTTDNNWKDNVGTTTAYIESPFPDEAVFDDTPGADYVVTLDETVNPYSVMASNSAYNATIAGAGGIGGIGYFTKLNAGTLTLGATNTFTGGAVIGGGEVIVASTGILAGATCALTITNAVLTLDNDAQTVGEFSGNENAVVNLGGGHTLTVQPAGAGSYSGVFAGSGELTVNGTGTLTLDSTGANTASGLTTVSDGFLALNKSGVNAVGGDLTVSGTGTARLFAADQITDGATVTIAGGTLDLQGFDDTVASVVMTGSTIDGSGGTLTAATYNLSGGVVTSGGKLGAGTLNSSGTVSLNGTAGAGTVNVTAGVLTFGADERLDDAAGLFVAGGTLALGVHNETVGLVTLSAGAITGTGGTLAGSAYDVQDGSVSAKLGGGAVALTKNSTGTVTLSGVNTYSGGVTVNDGVLTVNSGASLAEPGSVLLMTGGTLNLNNTAQTVASFSGAAGTINLGSGHTLTTTQTVATTFSGELTGAGGMTLSGTGTLTLDGVNTYSGTKTLSAGVLVLGSADALGASGAVNLIGGTLQHTAANTTDYSPRFSLGNGKSYKVDTAGQNLTWSAALTGNTTSSLTKNGTGTLRLTGYSTYQGTTAVNDGTLVVGDGGGSGSISNSSVILANNAALIFDRSVAMHYPAVGGAPNISGSGSVTVRGGAAVRLNSVNAYTGNTVVESGTLTVGTGNAVPGGPGRGNVTINTGATIGTGGGAFIANGLNGGGNISGGSAVTVYNEGQNSTYSGIMSAGVLNKTGSGTLSLAGPNTTTGTLTVSNGTVVVSGTWAGAASVISGATLQGTGTVNGTVTVAGEIAPGTSIGTLHTGSQNWTNGGSYTWEINNATNTAGADPGWDLLSITGGLNLSATPAGRFTINIVSLTEADDPGEIAAFDNTSNQVWVIAHVTDAITNFSVRAFHLDASSFSNDLATGQFVINTNSGTNVVIEFRTNSSPTLTVPADQIVTRSTLLNVTASATSPDPDATLTFNLLAPPAGMTIDPVTGDIQWTPSPTQGPSTNTITVVVTAEGAPAFSDTNTFEVEVVCPSLSLSPTTLPDATFGVAYTTNVTAIGGDTSFTYSISAGDLPDGLVLNSSNGDITGTPTTPGTNVFTLTADCNSCPVSQIYTVVVNCATITLSPASPLPDAQRTSNYSQTISASGGGAPYTFAITSGGLPNNMSLASGGLLSGTPTNIGLFNFTVTATDTNGCTGAEAYALKVLPALPDTNKPKVVITAPMDKVRVFTTPTNIVGTASDTPMATASGVFQVLYGVNGGPVTNPASGTTAWTAAATFNPGTNTFTVKSVDLAGNESLPLTRTYILSVTSLLTVSTNGFGTITPTTFVGSGTPTNGAMLELNRAYTVTAFKDLSGPGVNYVFSNWLASVDGGPVAVAGTSAKYTFLMQTNLALTTVFETNRFMAAAGMYYGLFTDQSTPIVSFERSGLFTLKTDSKQKFSGKLYLDGNVVGYAGTLNLDGYGVSKPAARKGKAGLVVSVQLTFDGSDSVSGTVAALSNAPSPYVLYPDAFTSALTGFKAGFNLTNNPATNLLGTYTMVLDVPAASESPKGNGYGLITMKTNGQVVSAGYLGDYAPFKPVSVYISKDGDWPMYATTYKGLLPYQDKNLVWKTNKEFNGMIWGWMKFTNNTGAPAGRELLDGYADWIKYPNTNNFYPDGFTNHDLAVFASAYNAPTNPKSIRVLDITNGHMVFVDGNLTATMSNHFFMNTNSVIKIDPPNVNTQTMAVVYKTGGVKGKFYHPNDPLNPVRVPLGAVLQDENLARGVFKGTNASGSFLLQSD